MCELPLARHQAGFGRRRVGEIRIPVGELLSSSAAQLFSPGRTGNWRQAVKGRVP